MDINEAIDSFFKLKNEYETLYHEKYVKPILNSDKSIKEKKSQYQKLPKPKCVNCKRNVATLFTIKTNNDLKNRVYKAVCGDINNPCPLDINIIMPLAESFDSIFAKSGESNLNKGGINELKNKIITAKNEVLFGYVPEILASDLFSKLTAELKTGMNSYDFFLEEYISITDNPKKNNLLKMKKIDFGIRVQEFKDMINEFNKTNNQTTLNSAVEFYINTMMKDMKEIRDMSYAYNAVDYKDKEYYLIQNKNTLEQLTHEYDKPKIKSYVIGTENGRKKSPILVKNEGVKLNKLNKKLVLVPATETDESVNDGLEIEILDAENAKRQKEEYEEIERNKQVKRQKELEKNKLNTDNDWVKRYNNTFKKYYYYNKLDGTQTWNKPNEYIELDESKEGIKSNWIKKYSNNFKQYYYLNTMNNVSQWDKPEDYLEP